MPFSGTQTNNFIVPKLENLKSVTYFIFLCLYLFTHHDISRRLWGKNHTNLGEYDKKSNNQKLLAQEIRRFEVKIKSEQVSQIL